MFYFIGVSHILVCKVIETELECFITAKRNSRKFSALLSTFNCMVWMLGLNIVVRPGCACSEQMHASQNRDVNKKCFIKMPQDKWVLTILI